MSAPTSGVSGGGEIGAALSWGRAARSYYSSPASATLYSLMANGPPIQWKIGACFIGSSLLDAQSRCRGQGSEITEIHPTQNDHGSRFVRFNPFFLDIKRSLDVPFIHDALSPFSFDEGFNVRRPLVQGVPHFVGVAGAVADVRNPCLVATDMI